MLIVCFYLKVQHRGEFMEIITDVVNVKYIGGLWSRQSSFLETDVRVSLWW